MPYRLIIRKRNIDKIIHELKSVSESITSVDLSSAYVADGNAAILINTITASNLVRVLEALSKNVSSLDMRLLELYRYSFDDLLNVVNALPENLVALDWESNGLGKIPLGELVEIITALPANLVSLGLRMNEFYKLPADDFVRVISALPKKLESLDLSGNLYDFCVDDIVRILQALPQDILHLDLSWNEFHKFSSDELSKIFGALPAGLSTLNVSFNKLGNFSPENLSDIMNALPKKLNYLDASANNLEKFSVNNRARIIKNVPTTLTEVVIEGPVFDPLVFVIENEIQRLMSTHSTNSNIWVSLYIVHASDSKINALNELKDILGKRADTSSGDLVHELAIWHEANIECIKAQRNKVHSFFDARHKAATQVIVEDILINFGVDIHKKTNQLCLI